MYHHVIDRLGRQSKQKPTSLPKMECESKGRTNINRLSSSTWSFLPITWVMMLYILRSTACHNSCADTYLCLDKRLKKIWPSSSISLSTKWLWSGFVNTVYFTVWKVVDSTEVSTQLYFVLSQNFDQISCKKTYFHFK